MKKLILAAPKIHCSSCELIIVKTLQALDGVSNVRVDLTLKQVSLEYDERKINEASILKGLKEAGYPAEAIRADGAPHFHGNGDRNLKFRVIASFVLTAPLFLSMFLAISPSAQLFLAATVILGLGFGIHQDFIKQLLKKMLGMDALISIGTLSALALSLANLMTRHNQYFFEAGAAIITFVLLGRYLESLSKSQASKSLQGLFALQVKKAHLWREGKEVDIDVDNVKANEILIVKPGEKLPLDGVITLGESEVNESLLTGESAPVFKKLGDAVFASTVNINGVIQIKVTKEASQTMLAGIINAVREVQLKKPKVQQLADKIAARFVVAVLTISVVVFVLSLQVFSMSLFDAFSRALAVLVVSCPCSLGLATPIVITIASGKSASKGILFKDSEAFEKATNIKGIVFDKTGTLTEESFEVSVVTLAGKADRKHFSDIIYSLEINAQHPIAKAISQYFSKDAVARKVASFKVIPGSGVEGVIDGKKIEVKAKRDAGKPETTVSLFENAELLGTISLKNAVKANALEAVKNLKRLGLKVSMITGDNKAVASAVGKELGIEMIYSEVLPLEKQGIIKHWQDGGEKVAFVGDGINDSPALTQADLGIAMGTGSDIAKESGQIVIVGNDPLKVYEGVVISRKAFRIIKQNLFWAFFYNVLGIPLAALGIVPPVFAALAMSLSSVTVTLNALRLSR